MSFRSTGKVWIPKKKPMEIHQEEATTLDPELEEALSSATDTELHDLAGKNSYRNSQTGVRFPESNYGRKFRRYRFQWK